MTLCFPHDDRRSYVTRLMFHFPGLGAACHFFLSNSAAIAQRVEGPAAGPRYAVDPYWPKPLPNNWILGQMAGIATDRLGRPAHMELDPAANELFIADGYQNRRVIVFDAGTGAYKRHWGAYGKLPDDTKIPGFNPESAQFANPVHCVRQTKDNLLYVCDRMNNRIQVFRKNGEFVRQFVLEPDTRGSGAPWDLIPTEDPGQRYLLVADGTNNEVHILLRETGERLGSFGRSGRQAGGFHWVHNIAVDSQGSVYTSEVDTGKRAQRFTRVP